MKQNTLLFLSLVLVMFVAGACKNRGVKKNDNLKVNGMTKEEVLAKHNKSRADFDIMYFKGKADFESVREDKKQSVGFSYKVYLAKDSLLWASISKAGISFGTVLMDQDSVRIRITLGKTAVLCDFSMLSEMLGMDVGFHVVQSFFTGDPEFESDKLKMVPGEAKGIRFDEERPPYQVSWFLNGKTFKLDKMVAEDVNLGRKSTVTYLDFQDVSGQKIPGSALIEVTQPESVRIELEHTKIEIEPAKSTFNFRIPKSYEIKDCSSFNPGSN